eukprot:TRINITY_DN30624_c0_g1_i1.p1 TRINITY_DN30624_c0_g1~~TRINITY_DN30624_c0_g1_i1.p1  ORF type:complete len:123 (+),score=16.79 TRINITY_DN30624_c0_g1_i1:125-493(+)
MMESNLKRLKKADLRPFTVKIIQETYQKRVKWVHFVIGPFVAGWPVMDGVVYEARPEGAVDPRMHLKVKSYALQDVLNLEEVPFYDGSIPAVSYTHLRAHETVLDLVCRLLLEKKNTNTLNT